MWGGGEFTTARCPMGGQRVVDDGYMFDRKNSALATVMPVAEDMLTLHILPMLDAGLFACIHVAARSRPRFCPIHTDLAPFQSRRFLIGQLAGLNTLLNSVLLIHISLHIGLHVLRGSQVWVTGDIVVLQPIDCLGLPILCPLDACRFRWRQTAIPERLGFHPVNPRFPTFQPRRFAGAELSGL